MCLCLMVKVSQLLNLWQYSPCNLFCCCSIYFILTSIGISSTCFILFYLLCEWKFYFHQPVYDFKFTVLNSKCTIFVKKREFIPIPKPFLCKSIIVIDSPFYIQLKLQRIIQVFKNKYSKYNGKWKFCNILASTTNITVFSSTI